MLSEGTFLGLGVRAAVSTGFSLAPSFLTLPPFGRVLPTTLFVRASAFPGRGGMDDVLWFEEVPRAGGLELWST